MKSEQVKATKAKENKELAETKINNLMEKVRTFQNDPKEYLNLLLFLQQFRNYSIHNRILIASQREGATAVASFKKFKELGYSVRKGEHGLKIMAPIIYRKFYRGNNLISLSKATKEEKHKIKTGEIKVFHSTVTSFTFRTVFDVTQTDMPTEEYPKLYPNRSITFDFNKPVDQQELLDKLVNFANSIGFKLNDAITAVEYSNFYGNAKGVTIPATKTICLRPDCTNSEKIETLMHELGHAQLHQSEDELKLPRALKELEAQLTAFLVAQAYGLDNKQQTVKYIAGWTKNGVGFDKLSNKDQLDLIKRVQQAADKMINFINEGQKQVA